MVNMRVFAGPVPVFLQEAELFGHISGVVFFRIDAPPVFRRLPTPEPAERRPGKGGQKTAPGVNDDGMAKPDQML